MNAVTTNRNETEDENSDVQPEVDDVATETSEVMAGNAPTHMPFPEFEKAKIVINLVIRPNPAPGGPAMVSYAVKVGDVGLFCETGAMSLTQFGPLPPSLQAEIDSARVQWPERVAEKAKRDADQAAKQKADDQTRKAQTAGSTKKSVKASKDKEKTQDEATPTASAKQPVAAKPIKKPPLAPSLFEADETEGDTANEVSE